MTKDIDVTCRRRRLGSPVAIGFGSAVRRTAMGCLCVAATLSALACGEGVPTSPSALAPVSALGATASISGGTTPRALGTAPVVVNQVRPFHGSFEASEADEFQPPETLVVHLSATGNATDLGRFRATFDENIIVGEESAAGTGSFTLTAANGDTVFGTLTALGTFVPDGAAIVEEATVTGGTGRFAGATGSFTVNRLLVEATGLSAGSFDGGIHY